MDTAKQTALLTGANKGIGLETARRLARRGFTVWLGSRDQERGESAAKDLADDGDVRFVDLDVSDEQGVGAAAGRIGGREGRRARGHARGGRPRRRLLRRGRPRGLVTVGPRHVGVGKVGHRCRVLFGIDQYRNRGGSSHGTA